VNFGLFPPLPGKSRKADRKALMAARAREALATWAAEAPLAERSS
jgi:methylenetetrahydrofolate--tRNA-(uracil-5-)-methyltransferase